LILMLAGAGSDNLTLEVPGASAAMAETLPPAPRGGMMGFVVNHITTTWEGGKDDCPEGPAPMLRTSFLASLSESDRTRLLKPEAQRDFQQRYRAFAMGPDGTNICSHYYLFDRAPQKTVQGKMAQGFNLDDDLAGGQAASGCAHANFTSPGGEPGIDNQYWRAMGCIDKFRPHDGTPPSSYQQFDRSLANGENAQVLILRGVESLERDDVVEIIYGNSRDRAILDPAGRFVHGASYAMSETPGGPNVTRGRIVNGVLEARFDRLRLRQVWYLGGTLRGEDLAGLRSTWDIRRVRLRLAFQPDGSLKGLMGGYQALSDSIQSLSIGALGAAVTADWDCATIWATVKTMADGDRDPATGQCTTISTTFELAAVPAFVVAGKDRIPLAIGTAGKGR
jgi:hypothetical protein